MRTEFAVQIFNDVQTAAFYFNKSRALPMDDLIQDVVLKCLENEHKYDAAKGTLFSWVYSVTRLYYIDQLRKQKKAIELMEKLYAERIDEPMDCDSQETGKIIKLNELVQVLPEKQRLVVLLKYKFNCSGREISQITGIPELHVPAYMSKARAALRNKMAA